MNLSDHTLEPLELANAGMSGVVAETEVVNRNKQILEAVEKRLRDAEKNKQFKDTKTRKRGTQKEARAFSVITFQVLDELEEDPIMARKLVTKQKVWPEGIDWQKEKASGTTSGAAFLKTKLYRTLARQPFDSADARRTYTAFVEVFKATLANCKSITEVKSLLRSFSDSGVYSSFIGDLPESRGWQSESFKVRKKLEGVWGKSFNAYVFYPTDSVRKTYNEAELYDEFTAGQEKAYINQRVSALNKSIDEITASTKDFADYSEEDYIRKYHQTWTVDVSRARQEAKTPEGLQTIISRVNGTYRLPQIHQQIAKLKARNVPEKYKARKESWAWTKAPQKKNRDEPIDTLKINTRPKLDHISRIGGLKIPDYIGERIGDEYKDDLGIHAVQFGNSLPDDERKKHAVFTYASLVDLEELLGISVKAVNERHKLGIDFATRGTAGSAATYWPDYQVINLNRKSGDGSLAHEWAHYLDNAYSSTQAKQMKINGHQGRFATLGGSPNHEVDQVLKKWWEAATVSEKETLVDVVFRADDKTKLKSWYYKDTIEDTIAYIQTKRGYADWSPQNSRVQAQVYGSVAAHFGVKYVTVSLKSRHTVFMTKSRMMDGAKSKSYWASPVEMFARSFEEYVLEKMDEKGIKNTYLQSPNQWAKSYGVYPSGREKERINEAFDELFAVIRKTAPSRIDYSGSRQTDEQIHTAVSESKKNVPSDLEKELELEALALEVELGLIGMGGLSKSAMARHNRAKAWGEMNASVMYKDNSYADFAKNPPTLWGYITVNGKQKFGQFKPEWNRYTNSMQYSYYTEKGNKGTGGFSLKRAYDLLSKRRLSLTNDFISEATADPLEEELELEALALEVELELLQVDEAA